MVELKSALRDKYNITTGVQQGIVFGDNGLIKVQIEPPCTNPNCRKEQKKWLLRMAPSESFDRWSVSAAICERFDNTEQMAEYLSNSTEVYKALFKKLSKGYKELYDKWEDIEFEGFEKRAVENK